MSARGERARPPPLGSRSACVEGRSHAYHRADRLPRPQRERERDSNLRAAASRLDLLVELGEEHVVSVEAERVAARHLVVGLQLVRFD
eukprot:5626925-Prymnesium_polylepis.1